MVAGRMAGLRHVRSAMPKEAVAANDWEACAAYVRGMVDQIQR